MFDLSGKRVLVTGATGAIGGAVALRLAEAGACVAITGRNEERLNAVYESLPGQGHSMIVANLSDLNAISAIVEEAADGQKLYGLTHCAGGGFITPLRTISAGILQEHMQVNFYAFIELVRQMTKKKYIHPDGGSIVGISSFASDQGEQGQTAYSAAKAALDASVRTLSFELASKNVRINSIRPGMIQSDATDKYLRDMGQEKFDELVHKQLLGLGRPTDVANLCAFLLSEEGRFMTGRNVYLDGGRFI